MIWGQLHARAEDQNSIIKNLTAFIYLIYNFFIPSYHIDRMCVFGYPSSHLGLRKESIPKFLGRVLLYLDLARPLLMLKPKWKRPEIEAEKMHASYKTQNNASGG